MANLFGNLRKRIKNLFKKKSTDWKSPTPSFYSNDLWRKAYEMHKDKVEKGISIYAEIVGNGVQGADYTYGFDYEIFVYKITQTNVDGQVYELSWEALKSYCEKYGLKYVDQYFVGKVKEIVGQHGTAEHLLDKLKDTYLDKSYNDCKIDEGVCIKVRDTDTIYKLKSPAFIAGESASLEKGEVQGVD